MHEITLSPTEKAIPISTLIQPLADINEEILAWIIFSTFLSLADSISHQEEAPGSAPGADKGINHNL